MSTSFSAAFRSFWHTMTSYDRHATIDAPYRTGRHVPLANGQNGILTSVATGNDSRVDIASPYQDDGGRGSTSFRDANIAPYTPTSPTNPRPYSPGLRSQSANRAASQPDGFGTQTSGEIPMQSFQDGLPPAPPATHSWKRIDAWAEENYPELYDQLGEGATNNDMNELEYQLNCSLPNDVRESLMVHDGQEGGGFPTGIIFSNMLLDCEEIVHEWENWRKVNREFLSETAIANPPVPAKPPAPAQAHGGAEASSSKAAPRPESPASSANSNWRQDLLAKQDCVPADSIQKTYAHPAWIPLVRDWGGNHLAVDLAPGPAGRWGQVILFGRDYDTKYVVARSWGAFLAVVAEDLNSGKWFVDEDTSELKLREFKKARVEPGYFDILRWRMDQKHGRRAAAAAKRKSMAPNGAGSPAGSGSPYASPTEPPAELRGRTTQRLPGSSPLVSPIRLAGGPAYGRSSPLARVTEESSSQQAARGTALAQKLVEVETPRPSEDGASRLAALARGESSDAKGKENEAPGSIRMSGKQAEAADESMKTIEI